MSWNKKEFKDKYNRAAQPTGDDELWERQEEQRYIWDSIRDDYNDHEYGSTMHDIRRNYLGMLLDKLGIHNAKGILSYFWR